MADLGSQFYISCSFFVGMQFRIPEESYCFQWVFFRLNKGLDSTIFTVTNWKANSRVLAAPFILKYGALVFGSKLFMPLAFQLCAWLARSLLSVCLWGNSGDATEISICFNNNFWSKRGINILLWLDPKCYCHLHNYKIIMREFSSTGVAGTILP